MENSVVLYIECVKSGGEEEITLTFFNAVEGITSTWLQGDFLTKAAPVIGISEVKSAYYLDTKRIDII